MRHLEVVVLDVNGTLSDLDPLRSTLTRLGAPADLLDVWFAGTLRDGFALTAAGRSGNFRDVAAAVLRGLLSRLPTLHAPVGEAVDAVLDAMTGLEVHPDVPAGLRALSASGLRIVTLTNGSLSQTETLLGRAGVEHLVELRLSVDDVGRWKPHPDAYRHAGLQCGAPLDRCAMVAVHPWDLQGAAAVGMTTGWIDRDGETWPAVFPAPDVSGTSLAAVAEGLQGG